MTPKHEMSSSEIDAKITEFEQRLDRLYRQYEQYFIGIEKRPPRNERRQVTRLFRELDNLPMIKTAVKFRFRSLVQRFNSYKSYWNRVERQIEQGTYHRDLARAKARKQRREEHEERQQTEGEGRAQDGAFEIDDVDLEELDLDAMERELQEMEQRGEFEKYVGTAKMKRGEFPEDKPANGEQRPKRPRQNSWQPHQVDENVKQKRLAELQAKLGLSSRGPSEDAPAQPAAQQPAGAEAAGANNPFERSNEGPTQRARPENPSAPSRGADISKLKKLRRAKEKLERQKREAARGGQKRDGGSNRVIRRNNRSNSGGSNRGSQAGGSGSGDDHSRKIYNSLVKAKRRCNEDTSNLNYDSFKRTMDRQRTQIQKKKGARDVDFKVVIKDGRAFLKPETKK
jgi:hypothetical protein